ncbi:MAG: DHH family phosphoesterase [bacterium]
MFAFKNFLSSFVLCLSFLFSGNVSCKKVYMSEDLSDVNLALTLSTNITILIGSPDGDALSSAAALSKVLISQGKNVEVIHNGIIDPKLKFKPDNLLVGQHNQKPDLLIALDEAKKENLYWCENFDDVPLIKVDHHNVVDKFGEINLVDTDAAATCEVLIDVLKIMNPAFITNEIANYLAFGILCDTQGGERGKLKDDANKALSKLKELQVLSDEEISDLKKDYQEMMSLSTNEEVAFWNELQETLNIDVNLAYIYMSFDTITEGWHPINTWTRVLKKFSELEMDDVRLRAFIFYVPEGKIWKDRKSGFNVSLRSTGDEASRIADNLGGGGRGSVGGFFIEGEETEEVFEGVVDKVKEVLNKLD